MTCGGTKMDNDAVEVPPNGELPEYSLRVSMRAKRMQLRVDHWGRVEVVVPRNVSPGHAAPFVRRHRKWLERTLAQLRTIRDDPSAANSHMPDKVHLLSLGEEWDVDYRRGASSIIRATPDNCGQRHLQVETPEGMQARSALQSWVHDYARQRLLPWLLQISDECRLSYTRAGVRAQKTRWGSCSARGSINLNRHLLFLPPQLVRYVMIHELCHTIHLNHSRRYWALVGRFEPEFQARESELRVAACHIPLWAHPE
jgi:predicted metal-dependent hydrolase